MAYIGAEQVRGMRKELKELLPNFKISLRIHHHNTVTARIMEGSIIFL